MLQKKEMEEELQRQLVQQKEAADTDIRNRQQAEAERQALFRANNSTERPTTPPRGNSEDSEATGAFASGFYLPGANSPMQNEQHMNNNTFGRGRGRSGGRGRRGLLRMGAQQQQAPNDAYMSDSEVGSITTVHEEEEGWIPVGDQAAREALAATFGNKPPDESGRATNP